MQALLKLIARIGLVLTIVPAILFILGILTLSTVKTLMVLGMLFWFIGKPLGLYLNRS